MTGTLPEAIQKAKKSPAFLFTPQALDGYQRSAAGAAEIMTGRLIAVGDIHGCAVEFKELLKKVELRDTDRLVLLGDLVNRGPDSSAVLALAREHRATSLLGNHELRMLKYHKTRDRKYLKERDSQTMELFTAKDWAYLQSMPLTYEDPGWGVLCVHGGFLPDLPWRNQPPEVVTRIQVIDRFGRPRKRADAPDAPPWADRWKGPPFVIYGHTPRPEPYATEWALGIDTGCVMGGHLTAYVLPEKRMVQVKAKRRYFP